jgi:hypothetical protein
MNDCQNTTSTMQLTTFSPSKNHHQNTSFSQNPLQNTTTPRPKKNLQNYVAALFVFEKP